MTERTTAGHISQSATGELILGKVGKDLTAEDGYAAAQRVVLSLLATLKSAFIYLLSTWLGHLDIALMVLTSVIVCGCMYVL